MDKKRGGIGENSAWLACPFTCKFVPLRPQRVGISNKFLHRDCMIQYGIGRRYTINLLDNFTRPVIKKP